MVTEPMNRSLAKQLTERALRGDLRYDELKAVWPSRTLTTPLLSQIRDDLAEGVGHFPASVISRIPLWTEWYSSLDYKRLALNEALLSNTDLPDDILLRAHAALRAEVAQTKLVGEDLQPFVRDIVASYVSANYGGPD